MTRIEVTDLMRQLDEIVGPVEGDDPKVLKRVRILDAAEALFIRQGYVKTSMDEVAREAGVAKGTLYLYFKSKEELFLAALESELSQWFSELDALIRDSTPMSVDVFADGLAASLAARPRLLELMSLLHNVLEHNVDVDASRSFKRTLLGHLQDASTGVEAALPDLPAGAAPLLLMRMYALVVGYRQMADPAPNVAEALTAADLAPLRVDFEKDIAAALVDLIHGMCVTPPASR